MPIAYDDKVKRPNLEIQYTQDQILELDKCSKDFFYFCQYVKIKHPDKGRIQYQPRWYQKEFLEKILNNRYFVGLLSRQVGKTVSVSVYILWYAMFSGEKVIGIVSNKEKSAKKILREIKKMYESLPVWMKPGVKEYNMTSVEFDNGTIIMVSATTEDPFRGESLNVLVADELGFVSKSIAEEFWASNFPTLSASEESKIIVISTPNGLFNLFERLYTNAENNKNGFVCCKYDWRVIEGRDENWREEQIRILGKQKFLQEHEVQFLGSTNTVIDSNTLEIIINKVKEPTVIELNNRLKIWEKPIQGQQYIMGVDVAKGTGEHYSTFQVLKVLSYTPFKVVQVAAFEDNYTDVYEFAQIIYNSARYYNKAYLMVENNYEGSFIISELWWEHEYENLVNEGQKSTKLGIRATPKSKQTAVLAMKKLIESGDLQLLDLNTINQLTSFVDNGNNKFSGKDLPDDLVSSLYWACYITEFDIFENDIKVDSHVDDEPWGIFGDLEDEEEFDWIYNF